VPARQYEYDVAPADATYAPAGAGVHGVSPVPEYEPAEHGVKVLNGYAFPGKEVPN
jgi:hypothetical protein